MPSCTIGVISLDHPKHDPLLLKLGNEDGKVTHAEHVDVSDAPDSPLFFVAREKDDPKKTARLMSIDFESLKKLKKKFEN